jgi:hypothetical protein
LAGLFSIGRGAELGEGRAGWTREVRVVGLGSVYFASGWTREVRVVGLGSVYFASGLGDE